MAESERTPAELLALLDPPVWIVTAADEERRGGLAATNVTGVSIVPEMPRMVVGLARQHYTWQLVEASGCMTLHLISAQQADWVWKLGLTSGHHVDKFTNLAWSPGPNGSPVLNGAPGWLAGRVEARLDTGDRTLYLVEVTAGGGTGGVVPLTVSTLLALGSPEQKAELKRLLQRDSAIDAEAIRRWRGRA